jgi:peptidoglycan/xylan/chitin deacetylase (PgdA/CDA1 family)
MKRMALLFAAVLPLGAAEFVRVSPYLNGAKAAVVHTMDDSLDEVLRAMDVMDRYGIKTTFFVTTRQPAAERMWPTLRAAIANGHEVGAHSRTHQCEWPATEAFCRKAYSAEEVAGARDDILKNTGQGYVWSWCYPCGLCAEFDWVQKRIADAGYILARNYPAEETEGHLVPDEQGIAKNWYNASYTQVVQKAGGLAKHGRTEVSEINAKFDEVYRRGGVYGFMSHAQWLDFGAESFYEQHLKHVSGRGDVWYVPMGPLYMYRRMAENVKVEPLGGGRFRVSHGLDAKVYRGSLTLEFRGASSAAIDVKPFPEAPKVADRWDAEYVRRAGEILYVTVKPNQTVEVR